jgi:hypothetical protein
VVGAGHIGWPEGVAPAKRRWSYMLDVVHEACIDDVSHKDLVT